MVQEKEELLNLGALYFPGHSKLGTRGLVRNLDFKNEMKSDKDAQHW